MPMDMEKTDAQSELQAIRNLEMTAAGHPVLRPQLDVGGKFSFYYTPWTLTYEIPSGSPFGWKGTDGGTD